MTRSVPASRQSLTVPGFHNAAALAYKSSLLSKRKNPESNTLFSWLGEHYRVNDRHATLFVELDEFFPDRSAQAFGFGHASRGAGGHVSHRTAPSSRTLWAGPASNSLPLSVSPKCGESGFAAEMFGVPMQRGFRAHPQVRCGGDRIDFLVQGNEGRRLTIGCAGDRCHGPAFAALIDGTTTCCASECVSGLAGRSGAALRRT